MNDQGQKVLGQKVQNPGRPKINPQKIKSHGSPKEENQKRIKDQIETIVIPHSLTMSIEGTGQKSRKNLHTRLIKIPKSNDIIVVL